MKILYGNSNLSNSFDIINISKDQITKEELDFYADIYMFEIFKKIEILKKIMSEISKYKWNDIKNIILLGICLDYGIVKLLKNKELIDDPRNEKYMWNIDFPEIGIDYLFGVKAYNFPEQDYSLFQLWKYSDLDSVYNFSQEELDVIQGKSNSLKSKLVLKSYGLIKDDKLNIPIITSIAMPELFNQIDKIIEKFYNKIIVDIHNKNLTSREKHGIVRLITMLVNKKLIKAGWISDKQPKKSVWLMEM